MAQCQICFKKTVVGRNVSHSGRRTRKLFRPNLHQHKGKTYCTKCLRMVKREEEKPAAAPKIA